MLDWRKFYAAARRRNLFGVKGPNYGPAGHRGLDYAAAGHESIPTFVRGKCVLNGRSSVLGNYTVLKAGIWYYSWAHLLVGTRPDAGKIVPLGASIGKAADHGDDHGSAWTGPHSHMTRSLTINGVVYGKVYDPWAAIKKALAKK
jgi:hypothetical protein